jgi:hypothetical protein
MTVIFSVLKTFKISLKTISSKLILWDLLVSSTSIFILLSRLDLHLQRCRFTKYFPTEVECVFLLNITILNFLLS